MKQKTPEQAAIYALKMDFDVEQESGYWAGLEFAFGKKFAVITYALYIEKMEEEYNKMEKEKEKEKENTTYDFDNDFFEVEN